MSCFAFVLNFSWRLEFVFFLNYRDLEIAMLYPSVLCFSLTVPSSRYLYINIHAYYTSITTITTTTTTIGKVELEMQVLTTGYWPSAPPCSTLVLPEEITTRVEAFESFYRYDYLGILYVVYVKCIVYAYAYSYFLSSCIDRVPIYIILTIL